MRNKLLEWISAIYADRKIKISGEPYLEHLMAVAEMAGPVIRFGYEIGLCHDLLEDISVTAQQLIDVLVGFEYSSQEATYITKIVTELTDHFTADEYPLLKKKARKLMEDQRLIAISSEAQTVKYCDLIYNVKWTKRYQPEKAKAYLQRKRELLNQLDKGDSVLRELALTMTKC